MDKDIADIASRVENHFKGMRDRNYDEDLFNLGVELGRKLEKKGHDDFRLQYFIDNEKDELIEKQKIMQRAAKECLFLIKRALKQHVSQKGSYEFRTTDKFSDDIKNKMFVQADHVRIANESSFDAVFTIHGELADLFEKFKVPKLLNVNVINSTGEDYEEICNDEEVDEAIFTSVLSINLNDSYWSKERITEFFDEIKGFMLFKRVSV